MSHEDHTQKGTMKRIGYARVSTGDQSLNLQIDALKAARCDVIFDDVISGASRKRPGLDQALAALGENHQLVVWRLDRLGRSFTHLVEIADQIQQRGAYFISLSDGIDSSSVVGEIVYRLLSVFSDFERQLIVSRTVAGLAAARARGQKFGRRPLMSNAQVIAADRMLRNGVPFETVLNRYGVKRSTLYRARQKMRQGAA